jgi:hypothetical protein
VAENGDRWKTVRRMQSTMATTGGSPSFATTMWMTAHNFLSAVHRGSIVEPRLPWADMVLVLGFDSEVGRVGSNQPMAMGWVQPPHKIQSGVE